MSEELEIKTVRIEPRDVLLVQFEGQPEEKDVQEALSQIREQLNVSVMGVSSDLKFSAVRTKELPVGIEVMPGGQKPTRATSGASGFDLRASAGGSIPPGGRMLVPTGIRLAIPPSYEVQIRSRSGLAIKHGVVVGNSPGTIDSDYRGEIKVILFNTGENPFLFEAGDRIAQMVVCPVYMSELAEDPSFFTATERGEGGFGSTGKG